jgi:hypothetical protein
MNSIDQVATFENSTLRDIMLFLRPIDNSIIQWAFDEAKSSFLALDGLVDFINSDL